MSMLDRITKAILGGKTGGPHAGGIYTYHSSPRDFDRFDWSKLRSGEGGNTYGAGFYSAENPKVSGRGGQYWQMFSDRFAPGENEAARYLRNHEFDRAAAGSEAEDVAKYYRQKATEEPLQSNNWNMRARMIEGARDLLQSDKPIIGPRTYELNLRVKPDELLDWDKTFAQQSPYVQDATRDILQQRLDRQAQGRQGVINKYGGEYAPVTPLDELSGRSMYEFAGLPAVSKNLGYQQSTKNLRDAGIPGIRYLDQGSRVYDRDALGMIDKYGSREAALTAAQARLDASHFSDRAAWEKTVSALQPPTYNYVMFDPSKIDIMAKYGIVGGAAALGAAAAGTDRAQAAPTFEQRWPFSETYAQDQYGGSAP